jgi:hypothetical protein
MSSMKPPAPIAVESWGKDHWSLLAYVETLCVDSRKKGVGEIDNRRMRTNEETHPLLCSGLLVRKGLNAWKSEYGTRLAGYFGIDENVASKQLPDHDDWDAIDDLEHAGLIEILSLANGLVRMTDKGKTVSAALRSFKSSGGNFADFRVAVVR